MFPHKAFILLILIILLVLVSLLIASFCKNNTKYGHTLYDTIKHSDIGRSDIGHSVIKSNNKYGGNEIKKYPLDKYLYLIKLNLDRYRDYKMDNSKKDTPYFVFCICINDPRVHYDAIPVSTNQIAPKKIMTSNTENNTDFVAYSTAYPTADSTTVVGSTDSKPNKSTSPHRIPEQNPLTKKYQKQTKQILQATPKIQTPTDSVETQSLADILLTPEEEEINVLKNVVFTYEDVNDITTNIETLKNKIIDKISNNAPPNIIFFLLLVYISYQSSSIKLMSNCGDNTRVFNGIKQNKHQNIIDSITKKININNTYLLLFINKDQLKNISFDNEIIIGKIEFITEDIKIKFIEYIKDVKKQYEAEEAAKNKRQADAEAKRQADAEAKRQADAEAKRQADEKQKRQDDADKAAAKQAEDAKKQAAAEEEKRQATEDAKIQAALKKAEEEKTDADKAAAKQAEEAKRQAAAEEEKRQAAEDAKIQAALKKAEEEADADKAAAKQAEKERREAALKKAEEEKAAAKKAKELSDDGSTDVEIILGNGAEMDQMFGTDIKRVNDAFMKDLNEILTYFGTFFYNKKIKIDTTNPYTKFRPRIINKIVENLVAKQSQLNCIILAYYFIAFKLFIYNYKYVKIKPPRIKSNNEVITDINDEFKEKITDLSAITDIGYFNDKRLTIKIVGTTNEEIDILAKFTNYYNGLSKSGGGVFEGDQFTILLYEEYGTYNNNKYNIIDKNKKEIITERVFNAKGEYLLCDIESGNYNDFNQEVTISDLDIENLKTILKIITFPIIYVTNHIYSNNFYISFYIQIDDNNGKKTYKIYYFIDNDLYELNITIHDKHIIIKTHINYAIHHFFDHSTIKQINYSNIPPPQSIMAAVNHYVGDDGITNQYFNHLNTYNESNSAEYKLLIIGDNTIVDALSKLLPPIENITDIISQYTDSPIPHIGEHCRINIILFIDDDFHMYILRPDYNYIMIYKKYDKYYPIMKESGNTYIFFINIGIRIINILLDYKNQLNLGVIIIPKFIILKDPHDIHSDHGKYNNVSIEIDPRLSFYNIILIAEDTNNNTKKYIFAYFVNSDVVGAKIYIGSIELLKELQSDYIYTNIYINDDILIYLYGCSFYNIKDGKYRVKVDDGHHVFEIGDNDKTIQNVGNFNIFDPLSSISYSDVQSFFIFINDINDINDNDIYKYFSYNYVHDGNIYTLIGIILEYEIDLGKDPTTGKDVKIDIKKYCLSTKRINNDFNNIGKTVFIDIDHSKIMISDTYDMVKTHIEMEYPSEHFTKETICDVAFTKEFTYNIHYGANSSHLSGSGASFIKLGGSILPCIRIDDNIYTGTNITSGTAITDEPSTLDTSVLLSDQIIGADNIIYQDGLQFVGQLQFQDLFNISIKQYTLKIIEATPPIPNKMVHMGDGWVFGHQGADSDSISVNHPKHGIHFTYAIDNIKNFLGKKLEDQFLGNIILNSYDQATNKFTAIVTKDSTEIEISAYDLIIKENLNAFLAKGQEYFLLIDF